MPPAAEKARAPRASAEALLEAEKRAFLRMAGHELRTPLNSILGFSEILASELYGPLGSPQYKEYAEIVRDSGHKLLRLVNQLVDIARLESQAMDFDLRPEPLRPTLEEVLEDFGGEMTESAVRASVADADALPSVVADPAGLRSLLAGLIHNAIAFSPAGSEVRIWASRRGGEVEICIDNPGERVAPQELVRLRKPFEQGENASARRVPGAGLGLSICALTARAMHGRLDLAARLEGGLAVRVTLPAG